MKKVEFSPTPEFFAHPTDLEIDLQKYRSQHSAIWPASFHYRFEKTIGPVLKAEFRDKILVRNLLAKVVYEIGEQIKNGK